MPELRFDDRVAVVTGGGRGWAARMPSCWRRGGEVVVNDPGGSLTGDGTDNGPARDVVAEITAAGGEAVANTDSVATADGGKAIVEAAIDRYGRFDVLVHNAGIVRRASLKEMSYEDFEAVLDVHLRGAFHVVRQAFLLMCDAGYGRIVLTSSIGGLYGNHEVANYAIAKAGMIGLSNVAAMEGAAEGVKSNVIVPAAVTRMAEGIDTSAYPPMGPELVAPVVGWLAHETCSITGEILAATGRPGGTGGRRGNARWYRPSWSIADVGEHMAAIRDASDPVVFPVVPTVTAQHIRYSFAWQHKEPSVASQGPLAGVRVVDLTAMVMGPYCTQMMADMGADVIKIEPPEGDNTRYISVGPAPGMSGVYMNVNRGKRAMVLDLRTEGGRTALRALIRTADVFIHSMRSKAVTKLGFGYDDVAAINPSIVYTNCYGYGRRGPNRDLPAYDDTIQAECGLPAVQEQLTGEANYVGTIIADKVAGLTALYATMMALFHRERTGEGQEVEVSMFETMASFMLVEHANGAMFDPRSVPPFIRAR